MIVFFDKLREIYSNDTFIICDIIVKVIAIILVLFIIRRVLKLRKFYSKSLHDKYYNSYDNNCEDCDGCEDCGGCEDCDACEDYHDWNACEDCDDCEDEEVYEDGNEEDGDEEDYNEEDYNEEVYDEDRELSPNEKRKQTMLKKYGVPYAFMLKRK